MVRGPGCGKLTYATEISSSQKLLLLKKTVRHQTVKNCSIDSKIWGQEGFFPLFAFYLSSVSRSYCFPTWGLQPDFCMIVDASHLPISWRQMLKAVKNPWQQDSGATRHLDKYYSSGRLLLNSKRKIKSQISLLLWFCNKPSKIRQRLFRALVTITSFIGL